MAKGKGASSQHRGRQAKRPGEIPKHGWMDILWRVKDEISNDNVSIVAAGIAFYGLLAFVPAIVALMSIWALVFGQFVAAGVKAVLTRHYLKGPATRFGWDKDAVHVTTVGAAPCVGTGSSEKGPTSFKPRHPE